MENTPFNSNDLDDIFSFVLQPTDEIFFHQNFIEKSWVDILWKPVVLDNPVMQSEIEKFMHDHPIFKGDYGFVTEVLTREKLIEEKKIIELSALGVYHGGEAWDGVNLLCNWAPTGFELDGQNYNSIESFYHSLKYPEDTEERIDCANISGIQAQLLTRRKRSNYFQYQGDTVIVGSFKHLATVAKAISAKVIQNNSVRESLKETCWAKLEFPLTYTKNPTALGRVTSLALMIERWKLFGPIDR